MDVGQSILLGLFALSFAGGLVLVAMLCRQQAKTIEDLEAKLDVYVDTSINVARSVDRLSIQGVKTDLEEATSSRRWLIDEARTRVERGEEVVSIGRTLGLSGDEVRLLRVNANQAAAAIS